MSLPTRDEFIESLKPDPLYDCQYSEPKYQCPRCHEGGMREDRFSSVVLACLPPKHRDTYECDKCGYRETITT